MSQKVDNEPEELLGMNIAKADGTIELNQSRYAREIYNTYRDQEVVVKVASTPMKDNVKLSKANADPEYMNELRKYARCRGNVVVQHAMS